MKNEVNITNILKEFDEKFPRENDESISRFCRLDFFEGDSRSIKSFLQEQIRLILESCPCEEKDMDLFLDKSLEDIDEVNEAGKLFGYNQKCAEIRKWRESLLE